MRSSRMARALAATACIATACAGLAAATIDYTGQHIVAAAAPDNGSIGGAPVQDSLLERIGESLEVRVSPSTRALVPRSGPVSRPTFLLLLGLGFAGLGFTILLRHG